jgi:transcriptional regulator with XRE-family HTH domain
VAELPYLLALGEAIRQVRLSRAISQEQLGLETGIHRNYVGGIERGERSPTVAVILKLADALEVQPSSLFVKAERVRKRGRRAR